MNDRKDWPPPWVFELDAGVWITSPDGALSYINDRAAALLPSTADLGQGQPCYKAIMGYDLEGNQHCRAECDLQDRARRGERLEPIRMRIGEDPEARWICLVAIPVTGPDDTQPWLIHIAHDVSSSHRSLEYLTRVAYRSTEASPVPVTHRVEPLTRREYEVLDLLSQNENVHGIARRIYVSYTTVRNHIQNILRKLDVHSMQEAVALHLLRDIQPQDRCLDCESPDDERGHRCKLRKLPVGDG